MICALSPKTKGILEGFPNVAGQYKEENLHFLDLLTLVCSDVAQKSVKYREQQGTQMPCFFSTLQKHLFLPKYWENE